VDERTERSIVRAGCAHFSTNGATEEVMGAIRAERGCHPEEAEAFLERHREEIDRIAQRAAIHATLMRMACR
jgi:hypothetical protein